MRIDELPGVDPSDASWWKLVRAMGVIRDLEQRVAELGRRAEMAEAHADELAYCLRTLKSIVYSGRPAPAQVEKALAKYDGWGHGDTKAA